MNNPLINLISRNSLYIIIALVSLLVIYFIIKLLTRKRSRASKSGEQTLESIDLEGENDEIVLEGNEVVDDPYATNASDELTDVSTQNDLHVTPHQHIADGTPVESIEQDHLHIDDESLTSSSVLPEDSKQASSGAHQQSSRKKREFTSGYKNITKENFKEFTGKRLLVAEDNLINQKVIKGLLADSGIDVVLAEDGQIVLDILQDDPNFEIILMDAHMPRIDGLEASRLIRQNSDYDHIAIAALSGDTAADDKRKMSEAGMDEQLEKPLKVDALYALFYAYYSDETSESKVLKSDETPQSQDFIDDTAHEWLLNTDAGLENCANDVGLYKELLNDFIATYGDASNELSAFIAHDNFSAAAATLLDIKGLCDSLGASKTAEDASVLRVAIIDNNQKELFDKIDQFKHDINALIKEIQIYLQKA